jgi:hypothetical protein
MTKKYNHCVAKKSEFRGGDVDVGGELISMQINLY